MAKIIYFIAGNKPTVGEAADIAKLEAATGAPYELAIRSNVAGPPQYGEGRFEACDFVAGTLPADDDANDFYAAIDEIDPDAIPATGLSALQAVVTHNVDMVVPVTGVYATKIKATVVAGVITGFVMS